MNRWTNRVIIGIAARSEFQRAPFGSRAEKTFNDTRRGVSAKTSSCGDRRGKHFLSVNPTYSSGSKVLPLDRYRRQLGNTSIETRKKTSYATKILFLWPCYGVYIILRSITTANGYTEKSLGREQRYGDRTFRSESNFVDENRILYHNIYSRPVNHSCRLFGRPAASPQSEDLVSNKRNTQFVLRFGVVRREFIIRLGFAYQVLCRGDRNRTPIASVDCFLSRRSSPETYTEFNCW